MEAMRRSISGGTPYLFPNIRCIRWDSLKYSLECVELLVNLISPRIEALTLYVDDDRIFHCFRQLAITRIPALRSLDIELNGDWDYTSCEKSLQDFLTFYSRTLASVNIHTSFFHTPLIVECLSKMPNLRSLQVYCRTKEELKRNEIRGVEGGFPSLHSLGFDGLFQTFHDVYLKPYGLASLTTLTFEGKFTPDEVRMSVSSVVASCPRIRNLTFRNGYLHSHSTYTWPVIPWTFVQPISCCKELSSLILNWMRVSITLMELVEFLKSRTTWTGLHILTLDPLRLEDMLLYTQYCPNIKHLGIHVSDAHGFCISNLPSDLPTFSILTSIDFAGSNIKSAPRLLAQFLHRICKKPPHRLNGLDHQIKMDVLESLAKLYIDEQGRTGGPMLSGVREFLKSMVDSDYPLLNITRALGEEDEWNRVIIEDYTTRV